ncbi:hypothetical protein ACFV23_46555, partial [Streptomyces sp. NPDC059627]
MRDTPTETSAGDDAGAARRRELLAALEDRVRRWAESHDRRLLFSRDARREMLALLRIAGEGVEDDLEVRLAVGLYVWCRHIARRGWKPSAERFLAVSLLRPVRGPAADALPAGPRAELLRACLPPGNHTLWRQRAERLVSVYEATGEPDALRAGVELLECAYETLPDDASGRAQFISHTADQLAALDRLTGEVGPAKLLERRRAAVAAVRPADSRGRAYTLDRLAVTLYEVARATQDLAPLDEAVAALRAAVALRPEADPLRPDTLHNLGGCLLLRHRLAGDSGALTEAVDIARALVRDLPDNEKGVARQRNLLVVLGHVEPTEASLRERAELLRRVLGTTGPEDASTSDLTDLADVLARLYLLGDSAELLEEAVATAERSVRATDADSDIGLRSRLVLHDLLRNSAERRGTTPELLQRTTGLCREVVAVRPSGDPARPAWLRALCDNLYLTIDKTGDTATLPEATAAARELLSLARQQVPASPAALWSGVAAAAVLAPFSTDRSLFQEAVAVAREATSLSPGDDPDLLEHQALRARVVLFGHERFGAADLVTEVADDLRRCLGAGVRGPWYDECLMRFGQTLHARYCWSHDIGSLREAAERLRTALPGTPETNSIVGFELGAILHDWYDVTGEVDLLDEAVAVHRLALGPHPPRNRHTAALLSGLAVALHDTYLHNHDVRQLREAVDLARQSAARAPGHDSNRARILSRLSYVLHTQYHVTGDLAVLQDAVAAGRSSVSDEHMVFIAQPWTNLCQSLTSLYLVTGDRSALEEAEAVGLRALDHDGDHAAGWNNLATVAELGYRLTGDTTLLLESVKRQRKSVAATSPDHVDHSLYLSNLSEVLAVLYHVTGDLAPLEESVAIMERAVHTSRPEDHWHGALQSTLGSAALRFHDRTGDRDALATAVSASRTALEITPDDDVSRAPILMQLGLALRRSHALTPEPAHGEEAAHLLRAAAAKSALSERPAGLLNLAQLGIDRYDDTGDSSFLDEADRATAEGLELAGADSPIRATLQTTRGVVLWHLHQRDPRAGQLEEAFAALRTAAGSPASPAIDRVRAAWQWG